MSEKVTVPPIQIESALARIWDDLQGKNKMRACLFNMVIYTKKNKRDGYLQQVAEKVIQKFPSRIIFVSEDEHAKEKLLCSVSVLTANEGDSTIFCDLIEFEVSTDNRKRVPFAILPHLLPDLPIYLVWGDDPTKEDPLSFNLEQFATRTIFDSETAEFLMPYAKAIFKHLQHTKKDVADLNWARIESWRNLFASVFYSKEKLEALNKAKKIEISYNAIESSYLSHTKTQSIFLSCWLAAQLGWKCIRAMQDNQGLTLHFTTKSSEIPFYVKETKVEKVKPGRIVTLEIFYNDDDKLVFRRNLDHPHHIIIESCHKDVCELSAQQIFEKEVSGQSLVNEICHEGTSQHYLNMLSLISEIPKGNI
ncbi:MAG: glucose-6-phosphate dehydrogenase assembly protein OpcA [Chlamydiales bacterium]|nr:glucose-6-phosphate dehydrogenase assembly protein OpcA [Chlamydiales bacterium]